MGAMVYNGNSKTIAEIVRRLNQGGGGGTTDVDITPTLLSGTKIADYEINGTPGKLYAPTPVIYESGDNIQIQNGVISATDTTYDDFAGSTHGLVPPAQAGDSEKYLKADGTWSTPSGGGGTSVIANPTGTPTDTLNTIEIDNVIYDLPSSSTEETTEIIDTSTEWEVSRESSMNISWSNGKIVFAWDGGSNIGGNILKKAIIPASVDKIRYKITTGTSYSTSIDRFKAFIGIRTTYQSGVVLPYYNVTDWLVSDSFTTNNSTWEGELDLSNVSVDTYLYVCGHGWNMSVDKLELVTIVGGGTNVEITPTLSSGTKIADFEIGGISGELYAPSGSSNEPYSEDDIWTGSVSLMTDHNLSISNVYSDYDALRFEYQALGGNGVNYALEKTLSKNTLQRPNFVVSDFFLYSNAGVFVCGTMSANNIITTKYVSSGWFQDLILSKIVGIKMGKAKIPVEIYDYAEFDGTGFLTTPYDINADYTLEVIFDADYIQTMSIVGNSMGAGYAHLTIYNNYWYASAGTSEVILGSYTSGKHTFISNLGGKNILDNTEVSSYTPTDISTPYLIGNRVGSGYYIGKLYEFKLTSINTGNIVYDVVPAKKGNQIGLYDVISDTFTQCSFVTAVGND